MRIRVFDAGKGDSLLLTSDGGDHILVDGGLAGAVGVSGASAAEDANIAAAGIAAIT